MSKLLVGLAMFLSLLFLGQNCAPSHEEEAHGHHGLMDEIRAAQTPVHYDTERLGSLDTNLLIKVHATIPEVADFFTNKRIGEIRVLKRFVRKLTLRKKDNTFCLFS